MKTQNNVAVLVLNRNGKQFLKKCLKSLCNQTTSGFDLWLIDNNSSDSSVGFTKKNFSNVKILNIKENLGYTGAYNFTDKYFQDNNIDYNYYLFINSDTHSDSKLIETLVDIFKMKKNAGIVSPIIKDFNERTVMVGGSFLFATGTTIGIADQSLLNKKNKIIESFWASGCCFMTPSKLFRQLGGFSNFFMYYEDLDYSWKAQNNGKKVLFTTKTYINHKQGGSAAPNSFQMFFNERNRILTYYNNLPLLLFITTIPILLLSRIVLLPYLASSMSVIAAKIKGMISAIKSLHSNKKNNTSFTQAVSVIKRMQTVG